MGADWFLNYYLGEASAKDAYAELCAEARQDAGRNPNGTISSTPGFVIRNSGALITHEEAMRVADSRMRWLRKGEPCEAIPLASGSDEVRHYGRTVTVTVTVPADATAADLVRAVASAAGVAEEDVQGWSVRIEARVPVKVKVSTRAPKGPTETRYFVIVNGSGSLAWGDGHSSQSAARAALDAALRVAAVTISTVAGEVIAITRRATGEPLVAGDAAVAAYTHTVSARLTKLVTPAVVDRTRRGGWLFYGWAAS